ncbi:MAG: GAF domain-containing protein [Candidatus Limnocylindrales bacterium]
MVSAELRRLVSRHRHVAPMLAVLLAATQARVTISDAEGEVILDRQAGSAPSDAPVDRHPIKVEGATVGWVEGPRPAGAIAAVLSYAAARETDKRALAREALDRYRELNLIYDLAEQIGATLEVDAVTAVAIAEAGRLPSGGEGFLVLRDGPDADQLASGILGAIAAGEAEIINDVAGDPRATSTERVTASLVAAPLLVRGERIGIIGTRSATPVEYHASDLKLLMAIASLAAPTLDQAATHESALRAATD